MKHLPFFRLNQPLTHTDHRRPLSRREFIAQGFAMGGTLALGASLSSLFHSPQANALSAELTGYLNDFGCGAFSESQAKIPFICFDLAGGANIAGSNVLVGGAGGQRDFLSTSGYQKQGLPVGQTPDLDTATNPLIDDRLGLLFHSDSQLLAGIVDKVIATGNINGAVIPARSENDTGNNPHNPMYAINRYATSQFDGNGNLLADRGASGRLLSLIGSRSSESGANSMSPAMYIEPEYRPTKVDRASDATGLVDTGDLVNLLGAADTEAVMASIYRLSHAKLGRVDTTLTTDDVVKDLVRCGYLKGALNAEQSPNDVNPELDSDIVGPSGIFTQAEYNSDREFQKTAAIMKLVIDGYAGAGTITMGGYDYHTGDRRTGEMRDLRAGRCIGACLEYARRANGGQGVPLMVYVYSDGSVFSNGMIDDSAGSGPNDPGGRGKGVWTGDNQQTAASFFLVYNPAGRPILRSNNGSTAQHQQIGYMRSSGDVETTATPIANNVNLLVDAITLNYMALHGDQGRFVDIFGNSLGNSASMDSLIAFNGIR